MKGSFSLFKNTWKKIWDIFLTQELQCLDTSFSIQQLICWHQSKNWMTVAVVFLITECENLWAELYFVICLFWILPSCTSKSHVHFFSLPTGYIKGRAFILRYFISLTERIACFGVSWIHLIVISPVLSTHQSH